MKKSRNCSIRYLILFITVVLSVPLYSQEPAADIFELLRLETTLKSISAMTYEELMDAAGEYVILTGAVASRTVLNEDPADFIAQIELIDGEWEGTEQVFMYQAIVLVQGSEWIQRIPPRRSREENPDEITLSSDILVIGRILEPQRDAEGNLYRIVEGLYIRDI